MQKLKVKSDSPAGHLKEGLRQCLAQVFGMQVHFSKWRPPSRARKQAILEKFSKKEQKNLIELEFGIFNPVTGEFFLSHDTGMFSCLSVTLWSLCDLIDSGQNPEKINFNFSFSAYQDSSEDINFYEELFRIQELRADQQSHITDSPSEYVGRFDHHKPYSKLNFKVLAPLLNHFFQPAQAIIEKREYFTSRYLLPDQRYIGVCIRGTDKGIEVPPTDSALYIERTSDLLDRGLADRVFIQTDQQQICDIFKHRFHGFCDAIEELPRTGGKVVMHKTAMVEGTRTIFAQNMFSAVSLISRMPHVITHTGNIGAWIALMRGHTNNLWQATDNEIVDQSIN